MTVTSLNVSLLPWIAWCSYAEWMASLGLIWSWSTLFARDRFVWIVTLSAACIGLLTKHSNRRNICWNKVLFWFWKPIWDLVLKAYDKDRHVAWNWHLYSIAKKQKQKKHTKNNKKKNNNKKQKTKKNKNKKNKQKNCGPMSSEDTLPGRHWKTLSIR